MYRGQNRLLPKRNRIKMVFYDRKMLDNANLNFTKAPQPLFHSSHVLLTATFLQDFREFWLEAILNWLVFTLGCFRYNSLRCV